MRAYRTVFNFDTSQLTFATPNMCKARFFQTWMVVAGGAVAGLAFVLIVVVVVVVCRRRRREKHVLLDQVVADEATAGDTFARM